MQPTAESEAEDPLAREQPRQCDDERCRPDSDARDGSHADAYPQRLAWQESSSEGQRRQRGAVDQTQHEEREAERADPRGTAGVAANDGDPDDVVEPARQDEP
jgi:hypothetical protein